MKKLLCRRVHNLAPLAALLVALSWPLAALAHASLVRAQPAAGSVVESPTRIELWFNELLEDGFNSVAVMPVSSTQMSASNRVNFARGEPAVDRKDPTHLSVSVQPLAAGTYVVQWRVLSRDGHSAPGQFKFRVGESSEKAGSRR